MTKLSHCWTFLPINNQHCRRRFMRKFPSSLESPTTIFIVARGWKLVTKLQIRRYDPWPPLRTDGLLLRCLISSFKFLPIIEKLFRSEAGHPHHCGTDTNMAQDKLRSATLCVTHARLLMPQGRRLNGFLGLSFSDGTTLLLVILLDKTESVG